MILPANGHLAPTRPRTSWGATSTFAIIVNQDEFVPYRDSRVLDLFIAFAFGRREFDVQPSLSIRVRIPPLS